MDDAEIIRCNREDAYRRGDYVFSDRWARYGLSIANPTNTTHISEWDENVRRHTLVCDWLDTHEDDRIKYDVNHDYYRILGLAETMFNNKQRL